MDIKYRQSLSLDEKIKLSKERIVEWYEFWNGNVSIAFSGGKDSTVLLDLIRSIYPEVPAVFVNTGLEYPEILSFVKTINNVFQLRPKTPFHKIIAKYGYPIISKENAQKIFEARNTKSKKLLYKRLHGADNKYKSGKIPNKWQYLINAPFKISHKCCHYLKKQPSSKMINPYLGLMIADSHIRRQKYIRNGGCNSFNGKIESNPLSFWTEQDVWEYIKKYNIKYSSIYDMGYKRTGCMFCMFGVHLEKEPNRFQRMKHTHPKHYKYCMEKLGLNKALDYIRVNYI